MKRCSYCGAEYPDDATVCAIDGTPFDEPPVQRNPERAWFAFLILCSVAPGISIFFYLTRWQHMNDTLPAWALAIFRFTVFMRPLSIVAMWWGNRTGVIVWICLSVLAILVNLALGNIVGLGGIFGIVILIVLVRPRWQQMTWEIQLPPDKNDDA